MVSIEKFLNSFRNLKPDAVPRPPRPENEIHEDLENDENNTTGITIEPVDSSEDEKKGKEKKKSNNKKEKKSSKTTKEKKSSKEPSSPINTQATGNVINIVQCKDVRWGNQITYNLGSNAQENQTSGNKQFVKKTSSIKKLMESSIQPDHQYIDFISKNLGKNWHTVFKRLGYSQGRIETMELDEARNGVSEARYKLLLDWIRNDDDATLGNLSSLLWEEGERQIVKELADIYQKKN